MVPSGLGVLLVAVLAALVLIRFWRQVLLLLLSVLVIVVSFGLYQVVHLLRG